MLKFFYLEALRSLPATMEIQHLQKILIVFSAIQSFQTISEICFQNHNIQVYSIIFLRQGNLTHWKGLRILPMHILSYQILLSSLPVRLKISYLQTHNFFLLLYSRIEGSKYHNLIYFISYLLGRKDMQSFPPSLEKEPFSFLGPK